MMHDWLFDSRCFWNTLQGTILITVCCWKLKKKYTTWPWKSIASNGKRWAWSNNKPRWENWRASSKVCNRVIWRRPKGLSCVMIWSPSPQLWVPAKREPSSYSPIFSSLPASRGEVLLWGSRHRKFATLTSNVNYPVPMFIGLLLNQ